MGFSYCQLVFKPKKYTEEYAEKIHTASKKSGVEIVSFFAGYNDNFTTWDLYDGFKNSGIICKKYGKKRTKYIKSAALFTKSIGANDVLIHAGFIPNNPFSKEYKYAKKCILKFAEFCKENGINLLLETGGESPVSLLRLIEDLGLNNVFVNLDTANIIMYGFGNPVEAVFTLKNHIKSIHIKDGLPPVNPKILGEETPIGEGFVDFKKVFAELEKIGFSGPIIIEREIEGEKQKEDIINSVKYLDSVLNK